MILLLGNSDDILVRSVNRILDSSHVSAQTVDEADLFSTVPFFFEHRGRSLNGSLTLGGREIPLQDVSGVLVRLTRLWSPPPGFDLQDQVFIYHETGAAWFALLAGLECPAINRPALPYWIQDPNYPEALAHQLAERLAVSKGTLPIPPRGSGVLVPTHTPRFPEAVSFYAVDGQLIYRSAEDEALEARFEAQVLGEWQRENDLRFCRLDFEHCNRTLKLAHVESYPLMDDETGAVVENVAAAISEALA